MQKIYIGVILYPSRRANFFTSNLHLM